MHARIHHFIAPFRESLLRRDITDVVVAQLDHQCVSKRRCLLDGQTEFHKYLAGQTDDGRVVVEPEHLHLHREHGARPRAHLLRVHDLVSLHLVDETQAFCPDQRQAFPRLGDLFLAEFLQRSEDLCVAHAERRFAGGFQPGPGLEDCFGQRVADAQRFLAALLQPVRRDVDMVDVAARAGPENGNKIAAKLLAQ